jgi:hypothetical protein
MSSRAHAGIVASVLPPFCTRSRSNRPSVAIHATVSGSHGEAHKTNSDLQHFCIPAPAPNVFDDSPGMPCLVDLLFDAVPSHPRIGVTVPQHVLTPSTDNRFRWAFVPGFRVPSVASETWIDNESVASQHGMPLPLQHNAKDQP